MFMKRTLFCLIIILTLAACSRNQTPDPTLTSESAGEPPATSEQQNTPTSTSTAQASPTSTLAPTVPVFDEPDPLMGIQVHDMENPEQFRRFLETGAVWSRHDYFHWLLIEPENAPPSGYVLDAVNTSDLEAAVDGGLVTIATVQFTPAWAQKYPGVTCGPVAEDAFEDFAEFMGEIVSRYSQPPYNQKYWEIGNEVDIDHSLVPGDSLYGCWGEADDPYYGGRYYGEMLKVIYPAIKAADADATVLVGGLLMDCDPVNPPETAPGSGELKDCTASRFLEGILEAGGGDYFDGVSFHAYDYYYGELGAYGNEGWHSSSDTTGPALIAKTRYLKSLLVSKGYPDKELLNTEVAVLCGRDGREDVCKADEFANTKAYYIAQANAAASAEGLRANIWYSLTGWRGSGLVDGQLEPQRAYTAYQFVVKQLDRSTFIEPVREFEGVTGYKFKKEGKAIWLLWSLDRQAHSISLPVAYQAVYDVFGNSIELTASSYKELQITAAPVYVEWID